MKKILGVVFLLAVGLTLYNYYFGIKRCGLKWVDPARDVGEAPVAIARAVDCPDFPAGRLYLKRVARKTYVVYLEDHAGRRSRELPLDYPAVIGNYIRGIQLKEITFKGYRIQWANDGRLALDQDRVTKVPMELFP